MFKSLVVVILILTPCDDGVGYQRFGERCCLVFRNICILTHHHTASQFR